MHSRAAAIVMALAVGPGWAGDTWPEHRGPSADGHSDGTDLPSRWSETENIAWKTAIHDLGWSSPVVWNNQIWVTTATEDGRRMFAVCVDRRTGQIVHDVKVFDVEAPETIAKVNSYASPTPAIEKNRVYVHFGTYGTACLDTNTGDVHWARRDLKCHHHMGPGSSPILFDKLLIFQVDGTDVQYVVALDKATGETVWRTDRSMDYRAVHPFCRKSFCTPVVIRAGNRLQLVSPGSKAVMAYDPFRGDELWKIRYYGWSMVPRPLYGHGLVFVVMDYDHPELWAMDPEGHGDVTDSHVAWKLRKGVPSTPSLLLIGELMYMLSDDGVATCVEAKTGEIVWQDRVEGEYSSSPVYADGRIYVFNHDGAATVIKPGRQFEPLAVNKLDGRCMASPAVAGKALFVRTKTHLYRIENRQNRKAG
jgi:outer membrane protein assembly factor BamB